MQKTDTYEREILDAYEKGGLRSVATRAELERFKEAARATAIKDRRVNIRLSSVDLNDIQVRALEEGVPYQTLIASVLHLPDRLLVERHAGPVDHVRLQLLRRWLQLR